MTKNQIFYKGCTNIISNLFNDINLSNFREIENKFHFIYRTKKGFLITSDFAKILSSFYSSKYNSISINMLDLENIFKFVLPNINIKNKRCQVYRYDEYCGVRNGLEIDFEDFLYFIEKVRCNNDE